MMQKLNHVSNNTLKTLLESCGLPKTGNKKVLVDKIEEKIVPRLKSAGEISKLKVPTLQILLKISNPTLDVKLFDKAQLENYVHDCFREVPREPNIQAQKLETRENSDGYIYILTSPTYNCMLKIGTTKARANSELVRKKLYQRYRTALGTKLEFFLFPTKRRHIDERTIHGLLCRYRQSNSELFSVDLNQAISLCQMVTQEMTI